MLNSEQRACVPPCIGACLYIGAHHVRAHHNVADFPSRRKRICYEAWPALPWLVLGEFGAFGEFDKELVADSWKASLGAWVRFFVRAQSAGFTREGIVSRQEWAAPEWAVLKEKEGASRARRGAVCVPSPPESGSLAAVARVSQCFDFPTDDFFGVDLPYSEAGSVGGKERTAPLCVGDHGRLALL